jgi:hypothetical protein
MAYDLRSFLSALDKQGQLLRIEEEIAPEPDLAAAANAAVRLADSSAGRPARGCHGKTRTPRKGMTRHSRTSRRQGRLHHRDAARPGPQARHNAGREGADITAVDITRQVDSVPHLIATPQGSAETIKEVDA